MKTEEKVINRMNRMRSTLAGILVENFSRTQYTKLTPLKMKRGKGKK